MKRENNLAVLPESGGHRHNTHRFSADLEGGRGGAEVAAVASAWGSLSASAWRETRTLIRTRLPVREALWSDCSPNNNQFLPPRLPAASQKNRLPLAWQTETRTGRRRSWTPVPNLEDFTQMNLERAHTQHAQKKRKESHIFSVSASLSAGAEQLKRDANR